MCDRSAPLLLLCLNRGTSGPSVRLGPSLPGVWTLPFPQEALEALSGPQDPHLQGVPFSYPGSPSQGRRGLVWATRLEEGKRGYWSQKEPSGTPFA